MIKDIALFIVVFIFLTTFASNIARPESPSAGKADQEKATPSHTPQELAQLKAELAEKRQKYTDEHPEVKQLKRLIARLEEELGKSPAAAPGTQAEKPGLAAPKSQALRGTREIWVGDPQFPAADTPMQQLKNAVGSLGSQEVILRLPSGTYIVSGNYTIPPNITLRIERGAVFHLDNGANLIIKGTIEAGLYQILSRAKNGKVTIGPGAVSEVPLRWWGAKGDGKTDDTEAVQAALDMTEGTATAMVVGSPGDNYLVDTLTINPGESLHWLGRFWGKGATLTQIGANNVLNIVGRSGIRIEQWKIVGACDFVWSHPGLPSKPVAVTFDGRAGSEVDSPAKITSKYQWYYHDGTIYVYSLAATYPANNNPGAVYQNPGVQVDGKVITDWTRYFSGAGIYVGTGTKAGIMGVSIDQCYIRNFDKGIQMHYSMCSHIKDTQILNCNYGVYGSEDYGHNNMALLTNLQIAQSYQAGVYWRNAYCLKVDHSVIEVTHGRSGHFVNCYGVTLDNLGIEGAGEEGKVSEAFLFDNCTGVNLTGSMIMVGPQQAFTSLFRFINGSEGIHLAGNKIFFQDGKNSCAFYSTDGTVGGFSLSDNTFQSTVVKWTTDAVPGAAYNNNCISGGGWVTLPLSLLTRKLAGYPDYSSVNPTFAKPLAPPLQVSANQAAAVIDSSTGFDDASSLKITWNGEKAWVRLNNFFTAPPPGTYYGVLTLFYKADTSQTIEVNLLNAGLASPVPVAPDGQWRYLAITTPKKINPADALGLLIKSNAASGSLWIDAVSLHWFPTLAEANAWIGGVDLAPSQLLDNAVK